MVSFKTISVIIQGMICNIIEIVLKKRGLYYEKSRETKGEKQSAFKHIRVTLSQY